MEYGLSPTTVRLSQVPIYNKKNEKSVKKNVFIFLIELCIIFNETSLVMIYLSWVHTRRCTGRFVVMRQNIRTNRLHRPMCTRYKHAPEVRNNVFLLPM